MNTKIIIKLLKNILEAESTVAVIEKAGAKVAKNYDNLINDYQPALQNLIDSAREIDTILYSYSSAQDKFNQV